MIKRLLLATSLLAPPAFAQTATQPTPTGGTTGALPPPGTTVINESNIETAVKRKIDVSRLGQPDGVAQLDANGQLPVSQGAALTSQLTALLAGKLGVSDSGSGLSIQLPGGGTVALTLSAYLAAMPVPVEACGAKGDGAADDAPAFQRCGDFFGNIGVSGKPYRLGSPIHWSLRPVKITGAGWSDLLGRTGQNASSDQGSTRLLVGQAARNAITVTGSAIGSEFHDLAIVQPQPIPGAGWAPTQYPCAFDVDGTAGRVEFHNILMAPVYDGICAQGAGRLVLDGIYGQPLHRGVVIDTAYDTTHVGRVHLWPFWAADPNVMAWQQQNADAFLLGRVDGMTAPDVFAYGYRSTLHFQATASGSASKIDVGVLYSDATKWPIWVEGGNDKYGLHAAFHIGSMWADGEQLGPNATPARGIPGGAAILIGANSRADLVVDQFDAAYFEGSPVKVASTLAYSTLRFGAFNARYYNVLNDGSPAISLLPTSDPSHFNDIALAQPPILAPSYPSPIITNTTPARFTWPGFASSQLDVQHAVSNAAYETPGYTRSLTLYADSPVTLQGNTWRLPAHPTDGQVATLISPQNMAGLTVTPSPSGPPYPINGQPAGLLNGYTTLSYRFSVVRQAWLMGAQ